MSDKNTCWNCHAIINDKFKQSPDCRIFVDETTCSFFELLGLKEDFNIDRALLEQHYLEIQQHIHPDQFANRANSDKEQSLNYIMHVNDAYHILISPVKRAVYLLNRQGLWMENDELSINKNPALLMEIMELREDVAAAKDFTSLNQLILDLKQREKKLETDLQEAFTASHLAQAATLTITLQYVSKIVQDARQRLINQMS